jgi:hypothetical protein
LREQWVDFVGRLFRLQEAVLRYLFEEATRHSTEETHGAFGDFVEGIGADDAASAYLRKKNVSVDRPTTHILRLWLAYKAKADGRAYGPALGAMKKIEALANLRNRSILAHGYQGVSRKALESPLGQEVGEFVEQELRAVLTKLGADVAGGSDWLAPVVLRLTEI